MSRLNGLLQDNGQYSSYAWPGGYPLYYLDSCDNVLCPECVNRQQREYVLDVLSDVCNWAIDPSDDSTYFDCRDLPTAADINYDDNSLYCDACSERIESAYAEEEEENNE